ncbi:MAG: sensor histidine kinase [Bacteroidetes bacterium]|nr:sensor histidine kinase [Bacteroidota bacterium]
MPFDIEELMLESIQDFDSLLKSGQKIIYNHIGDRVILSDKSALKHIFQNLVSNALKFSRENSEVLVETTALNHTLTLKIQDFGIGIPKVDQTHLFERFYRAQNAMNIKGTGLGLHIVAKYVELLKGSIECSSEENKGTEFIIVLENV